MPLVDQAIKRLTFHLNTKRAQGYAAVKVIHGFGSSGTGGRIRVEARAYLSRLKSQGKIKDYITGEDLSIFHEGTRSFLHACPEARRDRDLERHNNGITVVVL